MKQTEKQNNQNKLRNKFLKAGVKMVGPETIFFQMILRLEKELRLNHMW